jgi:sodium transport system permease protein
MSWRNIRLIYAREIRDQLRDRRTLFMIAVLPLLLYPLIGMSVFQLSQFLHKSEPRVVVIGSKQLQENKLLPPLFENQRFAAKLFDDPAEASRIKLDFVDDTEKLPADGTTAVQQAEQRLKSGEIQVVLAFPPGFAKRMREIPNRILSLPKEASSASGGDNSGAEQLVLLYNLGEEKSRIAHANVERVVRSWEAQIIRENLRASRVPERVAKPFELRARDVAETRQHRALVWSKILPFVLFIWALTGAFYPAVDLCAGEKERGTLETLLSSPALRTEIVWGKLLTVMTFSTATALLNMASLGLTARYIIAQLRLLPSGDFADSLLLPPLTSGLWLLVALVPVSALFSALCLACAAFARSTKEGQYYLMPLLLAMTPLMMLPMAPGTELNLGNSLIPVTGVVLLLMALVQGNYVDALRYVVPVCLVTAFCCHWAIRWAVYQFNQESVLFRESERLDMRRWVLRLVHSRPETPTLAQAFFCVAVLFVLQFFTQLTISANLPASPNFRFLVLVMFVSQVLCIALPVLLMAGMLTGNPLKTLLLHKRPNLTACVVAVLLAVVMHPLGLQLGRWIRELYPVQNEAVVSELFTRMFETAPYWWMPYVLLAVLPAVCEELAFRGFVLSGLRHLGSKWWAVGLAALFFGMAHTIVQQSIAAAAVGLVIGYIAVQTNSLVPCILFHMMHNGLLFFSLNVAELLQPSLKGGGLLEQGEAGDIVYRWPITLFSGLVAVLLLWCLNRLSSREMPEQLREVHARQTHKTFAASLPQTVE